MTTEADSADLLLVGTGFASTFFLSEYLRHAPSGARVLVLDRARTRTRNTDIVFHEQVVNRTPEKVWVQKFAFGGSGCWTGNTPRPHPSDFSLRTRHGRAQDWPLDYEELEPFFCEVEEAMAIAGMDSEVFPRSRPYPQPPHALSSFDEAMQVAFPGTVEAMPSARASQPGAGRPPCCANGGCSNCPTGAKFEIAAHMAHTYDDPRVELRLDAEVKHLQVEAGRVRGVEYERAGRLASARAEFVGLGAHALFNPYLCLRSGLEHPAMGRYLHEQVSVDVNLLLDGLDNFDGGQQVSGYGTMFYDHDRRADWAGCNVEMWNLPWLRAERGRWRQRALIKLVFETEPLEENGVTVDPSHDKPVISHGVRDEWSARGIERVPELVEAITARLPIEDSSIEAPGAGEAHIQGTTRMSRRPEDGVVDPDLVHHSVRNLAILGSGAFPSCPSANPTLILSALSIRSARRLFGGSAS